MLIDDLNTFLSQPSGNDGHLMWCGCDIRFPGVNFNTLSEGESKSMARDIFAGAEFFDAAPLADILDDTYGGTPFRFVRDCMQAIPPYPKTVFQFRHSREKNIIVMLEARPTPAREMKVHQWMTRDEAIRHDGTPDNVITTVELDDSPLVTVQAAFFVELTGLIKVDDTFLIFDKFCGYLAGRDGQPVTIPIANDGVNAAYNTQSYKLRMVGPLIKTFQKYVNVAGMVLNLLACKNVAETVRPIAPELQKARQRRGKPALVEHKVLTITVPIQRARSSSRGQYETSDADNRRHKRKGYLADYRENGLFGKHKGLFWFPAWERGNEAAGIITKTYRLKPARKVEKVEG